jgi:hypothetical protein
MLVPSQSVKLPPIQPDTNVRRLSSIRNILPDHFTSSENGKNRNSSTLTLNGDVHSTNLRLFLCDPTPRAASDLEKHPSTPHNQPKIHGGGVCEFSRRRKDTTQRRDANLCPELPGTVTQLYECLHPGCESSFSSQYLLQ